MVMLCQISKVTENEEKKLFQRHFSLQSDGIIEMLPNSLQSTEAEKQKTVLKTLLI